METPQREAKRLEPSTTSSWSGMSSDDNWERDVLNRLAFATLNEQRRARRWRIFFILLLFVYLFLVYATFSQSDWQHWFEESDDEAFDSHKHTALVDVQGVIAADTDASADNVIAGLRVAFKDKDTAGVIIRINSPGGSPVQAGYIFDEIRRLREKYPTIPVFAVATDTCASGGYYVAAAADQIYADKASVIGSIGVLMNGFGFVDALKKLGIERRLFTAGEHKGFLDPFSPLKDKDVKYIETVLNNIHRQFRESVESGRGERLKNVNDTDIFSGLVWTGEQALNLGLVDALGSSSYVAREIIKAEKIKNFTPKQSYLDRFAERLGATMARALSEQLKLNSRILFE